MRLLRPPGPQIPCASLRCTVSAAHCARADASAPRTTGKLSRQADPRAESRKARETMIVAAAALRAHIVGRKQDAKGGPGLVRMRCAAAQPLRSAALTAELPSSSWTHVRVSSPPPATRARSQGAPLARWELGAVHGHWVPEMCAARSPPPSLHTHATSLERPRGTSSLVFLRADH